MAEKKINDRTFKVEPMLAMDALVLQARLFKALGPAMGSFSEVMKGRAKPGETVDPAAEAASNSAALVALANIFAHGEPRQIAELIRDIVQIAQLKRPSGDYEQVDLDGDFTGKQKDMFPVILFVLREQFADFFSGLPGLGKLVKLDQA